MSIAVNADARVKNVTIMDDLITFHLVDGRVISVPLVWSWRLSQATPAQRDNYEIIGDGQGVHWPDVDEDLSVEGMFKRSSRPSTKEVAYPPANTVLQPTSRADESVRLVSA